MKLLESRVIVRVLVGVGIALTIWLALRTGEQLEVKTYDGTTWTELAYPMFRGGRTAPATCVAEDLFVITGAQPYLVQCKAGKWEIAIPTFQQAQTYCVDRTGRDCRLPAIQTLDGKCTTCGDFPKPLRYDLTDDGWRVKRLDPLPLPCTTGDLANYDKAKATIYFCHGGVWEKVPKPADDVPKPDRHGNMGSGTR